MGKIKNLTGQRFGKLIVLSDTTKRKNRQVVWKCKCDCGREVEVVGESLRTGHTQSCGCLSKERSAQVNTKNIIGQQFGKLIVQKDSGQRFHRNIVWECQCQCENKTIIYKTKNELDTLHNPNCGCEPRMKTINMDIQNQRFGKLIALYPQKNLRGTNKSIIWHCKCDCGNEIDIARNRLITKNTNSCGCLKSKGEAALIKIFQDNHINFIPQKTFDNCRFPDTNFLAYFDFYLPDYQCIIEYDGIQHFEKNSLFDLEYIQEHDLYKTNWCICNNIKLYRIAYTDLNNLSYSWLKELGVFD